MGVALNAFLKGGDINQEKLLQVRQLIGYTLKSYEKALLSTDDLAELQNYIDDPAGSDPIDLRYLEDLMTSSHKHLGRLIFDPLIDSL